jgi:hypothetical protein
MQRFTRDELRNLYPKKIEEERLKQEKENLKKEQDRMKKVNQHVSDIYAQVIARATQGGETTFIYVPTSAIQQEFYINNISDIINGLSIIFTDLNITRRSILRLPNGKEHDITTLNSKLIELLGPGERIETILVDWT